MIVSCEHNGGGMGLCDECRAETHRSVERETAAVRRTTELRKAIDIAERYGCYEAAQLLRRLL